jgi:GTP-binding protein
VKFIDEATITVQSGNGGKGCVSFRRERFVPRGGPDGGDGGQGGNVVLKTTTRKRTLNHFQFKRQFKAQNGKGGQGKQQTGKKGNDLIIEIPPGTLVKNADTGEVLKDLIQAEEAFVAAKGGRGGLGNKRFATSTHRAPRFAQPGEPGETITLKLELKLLADVGIIGFPNAGKSTLISVLSSARPKIGEYPFTTLSPTLGVVYSGDQEPFILADIPGIIEGAHEGAGLGIRFLKHIERTRMLIHLIDASAINPDDPLRSYQTIREELTSYSKNLAKKFQMVVLNKMDLPDAKEGADRFQAALKEEKIVLISALTRSGIDKLKSNIIESLDRLDET